MIKYPPLIIKTQNQTTRNYMQFQTHLDCRLPGAVGEGITIVYRRLFRTAAVVKAEKRAAIISFFRWRTSGCK